MCKVSSFLLVASLFSASFAAIFPIHNPLIGIYDELKSRLGHANLLLGEQESALGQYQMIRNIALDICPPFYEQMRNALLKFNDVYIVRQSHNPADVMKVLQEMPPLLPNPQDLNHVRETIIGLTSVLSPIPNFQQNYLELDDHMVKLIEGVQLLHNMVRDMSNTVGAQLYPPLDSIVVRGANTSSLNNILAQITPRQKRLLKRENRRQKFGSKVNILRSSLPK